MRIIPDSLGAEDIRPTVEGNDCHDPGTGRFCSKMGMGDLRQGALWAQQRNERRKASARRRLEQLERRPRGRWPGGTDRVGIAAQRRRLVALGEAEEFPEGFTPLEESNDCHNPAGSPEGGQFCVNPAGIAASLAQAGKANAKHQAERAAILNAQPDGTRVTLGRQAYTKQTIGGDVFWVWDSGTQSYRRPPRGRENAYTSEQMGVELGRRLERLFLRGQP